MQAHNPTILAIVSKKTGAVRRIIKAPKDTHKYHLDVMHSGEMSVLIDVDEWNTYKSIDEQHHAIAVKAGFEGTPHPSTTRHALVDERGGVVEVIEADPSCGDTGEHHGKGWQLIQHPTVERGMIYFFHNKKFGGLQGRDAAKGNN